ncbi:MAG: oxidoreductase domain protein [Verrucomicrobiaceae bacterium]|nr:oxidoreductase domain protein [Verrucomicrobiaceae bacterium]
MDIHSTTSRRDFLRSAAIGSSVLSGINIPFVHAEGANSVSAVLIGCGGRGSGAADNALKTKTKAPIKLVAMADVIPGRLESSFNALTAKHPDAMSVSEDAKFIGFDAYQKAMDMLKPGDVAIVATPLAFRWVHFKYAIEKGINIFMEKPLSADGPTAKRLLALNEEAKKKGIRVAVGLMCRHCRRRQELFKRIQDGAIGEIILGRGYRMSGPIGTCFTEPRDPKANPSELLWQIQHFHSFLWASGGAYSDFLIHNIDEMCWMKNDWPVEAQGWGGRTDRGTAIDQNFDHYVTEFTWKDGTKAYMEGRNQNGCHMDHSTTVHGTKGMAVVSAAGHIPAKSMIVKGHVPVKLGSARPARPKRDANGKPISGATAAPEKIELPPTVAWYAEQPEPNPYDLEWEDFMDAIRNNKPYNELERGVQASVVTSMGRMACHTGQIITYDQMLNCTHEFSPNSDKMTLDGPAPLIADAQGKYPIPMAGIIKETEYKVG